MFITSYPSLLGDYNCEYN